MGKWTKSLPAHVKQGTAAGALYHVACALIAQEEGDAPCDVLPHVRVAAAEVRAWRKSLPVTEQGSRPRASRGTDRELLRFAATYILWADRGAFKGPNLRYAEMALRILGKRLMEQEASRG
jgi:hypothetical protein